MFNVQPCGSLSGAMVTATMVFSVLTGILSRSVSSISTTPVSKETNVSINIHRSHTQNLNLLVTQPLLIILVQIPQLPPFPVFFLRPLITRLPQHTALLPTTLAGNYLSKSSSLVSVISIIGRDRETNTATLDNSRAKGGKSREEED